MKAMTWRHVALEKIMLEGEHLPFQCYPLFSTKLVSHHLAEKKICKGSRLIFVVQARRVNLELRDK